MQLIILETKERRCIIYDKQSNMFFANDCETWTEYKQIANVYINKEIAKIEVERIKLMAESIKKIF